MVNQMKIHCCGCDKKIEARLTNGEEIYPHRQDLYDLPFWKCDQCDNFVGCHHKMKTNPTQPLGCIPTKELKNARRHIHLILDPIWQSGKVKRGHVYKKITDHIGWKYHTANIKTVDEARNIYRFIKDTLI